MRKRHTILFALLLIMSNLIAQTTKDSLVTELNNFLNQSKLPGFGTCITNESEVLYKGGHGLQDRANHIPYTAQTIQPIASISKTIIAVSIMQLVEQGKLDLHADINSILPFEVRNPKFPKDKITVFQLATHTSSIADTYKSENAGYYIINMANETTYPKKFAKYFKQYKKSIKIPYITYLRSHLYSKGIFYSKKIFSKHQPGTHYSYSNIAATLAAYIVELVSGQSFKTYTEENIFQPLGMDNTSWDKILSANQATLYFQNHALVPEYTNLFFPSSTLHTNSHDMGKYMLEIIKGYKGKGQLLNQASYDFMLTHHTKEVDTRDRRGIFWLVDEANHNFSHDGSNYGVRSKLIFNRELNIGIYLMTNIGTYEDENLTKAYYGVLSILGKFAKRL